MLAPIFSAMAQGAVIPYTGPGLLSLAGADCPLPASPEMLVAKLTAAVTVPHKIRNNLTAAAQFIENFKHRQTVKKLMTEAFAVAQAPTALHHGLASLPALPLWVHVWYDDLPQRALAGRSGWGMVQGLSQAEHFGRWTQYYGAEGAPLAVTAAEAASWPCLMYQPLGSIAPAANFLVSDADFVEVLTEIDIQTPIPPTVQRLRAGRNFLFLGCRFSTQLERSFARQIMKRSSDRHWAVLPEAPTRNETRFLAEQNIERIEMPLADFAAAWAAWAEGAAVA